MRQENEIYNLYIKNLPIIKSLARRYEKIDPSVSYEDLMQEGFIAISNAANRFITHTGLNFTSYLFWHLQKRFHGLLKDDKIVEIKYPNGNPDVVPYSKFLRIKRRLPRGTQWRVISPSSSLEELKERGRE